MKKPVYVVFKQLKTEKMWCAKILLVTHFHAGVPSVVMCNLILISRSLFKIKLTKRSLGRLNLINVVQTLFTFKITQ